MNSTPTRKLDAPTSDTWAFAEDFVAPSDALRQARDEAHLAGHVPISNGVASLLTVLAATTGAKAVVEVGTLMGASAIAFFEGMGKDGILTSIDADAEHQIAARRLLSASGYPSSRFRLIAGTPLEVLPKLRDGAYDVVFINGDKLEYVEYVAGALRLLRHGGLLIVHDATWNNTVADESSQGDETIIIREALEAVTQSDSYTRALLPVGNGLLVAVKH
ncbi:MAG: class I SAM-dependent methyltransferase [Propionibacteriaceae bacterium]|nr:class I SAM-dependent methyltransferase [Propionibacteriaceae bacterium]